MLVVCKRQRAMKDLRLAALLAGCQESWLMAEELRSQSICEQRRLGIRSAALICGTACKNPNCATMPN